MPGWNYKNGKLESFGYDIPEPTPVEELKTPSTKITIDSSLLSLMLIIGFAIGFGLSEYKYRERIYNAELIPYYILAKKGLAKPVKDENGAIKLKLMECK